MASVSVVHQTDTDEPHASNNNSSSFSPVRPVVTIRAGANKVSSAEFAEQIKRLESEGHRLASVAGALNLDHSLKSALSSPSRSAETTASGLESPAKNASVQNSPLSASKLASLVDIQADQKTIAELRAQLECQQKETERLQRQLSGEFTTYRSAPSVLPQQLGTGQPLSAFSSPSRSANAFTAVPVLNTSSNFPTIRRPYELPPTSHLEKALKESQEQVMSLRKRLVETNELAEQQKRQFRSTIEDVNCKLHETVVNRDRILDLRQKEVSSQESIITKLEQNVHELQEVNKQQEKIILESSKKVDSLNHHGYLVDSALSQIRLLLSDMERKRSRPLYDLEPISKQNPGTLVCSLETCLQDMEKEILSKDATITKLEKDARESQLQYSNRVQGMTREHQERVSQLVDDHAKQLESALERASNAREQSSNLQSQIEVIKQQYEQQLNLREETIRAQEVRLEQDKEKHESDRADWSEKSNALQQRLLKVEDELSSLRIEKEEAIGLQSELESHIESQQVQIAQLEEELAFVQDGRSTKDKNYDNLQQCKARLEKQVSDQQKEISQLERLLTLSKQESDLQLQNQAATLEKVENERVSEKIISLTNQLAVMSEKADTAILDLGVARTEINTFKFQVTELHNKLQVSVSQLEATSEAKGHLEKRLEDKTAEILEIAEDRDYYCHLVDKKNTELAEVKSERDKAVIQLEENDRNLKTIYQQSTNLSQIVEINSKASETVKEEKDRLLENLNSKTAALEEVKLQFDNTEKKLKARDKKLKELDAEKQRHSLNGDAMKQDLNRIRGERDKAVDELEKYRYHANMVTDERDKQMNSLKTEKSNLEKQLRKLSEKYNASEEELKLAQKTLKSRDSVDNKAVKVADKMQKEVTAKRGEIDKLKSKVHWMEEKIESLKKDKKGMEVNCQKLQDGVDKLTNENTALCHELSSHKRKHQDLKVRARKLQSGLEKAAMKNSSAQRQAEESEQEIARLKLNHQLEIKEVQSTGHSTKPGKLDTCVLPNTDVTQTPKLQTVVSSPKQEQLQSLQAYNDIGVQLKSLLSEVKNLISTQGIGSPKEPVSGSAEEPRLKTRTQWEVQAERMEKLGRQNEKQLNVTKWTSSPSHPSSHISHSKDISLQSVSLSEITNDTDGEDTRQTGNPRDEKVERCRSNPDISGYQVLISNRSNNNKTDCHRNPDENEVLVSPHITDTWAMCKRLEAKMESLSQMGGSLQKENKEMADLIKVQGKKLQRVRISEQKVHKKR